MELTFTLLERVQCLSRAADEFAANDNNDDNSNSRYPLTGYTIKVARRKKTVLIPKTLIPKTTRMREGGRTSGNSAHVDQKNQLLPSSIPCGHCVTIRGFSNWGART